MDNKTKYSTAKTLAEAPIFHQPWWLDAVCREGRWDACVATDGQGGVVGALPYYLRSTLGFKTIRMPPFTPYLGVWLDYSQCSERHVSRYSFENQVIGDLEAQLPLTASYHQTHPVQLQNWLPFYWRGYRQTTRYTYIIEKSNPEELNAGLKSELRTRIRKAEKLYSIADENQSGEAFFQFCRQSMQRQRLAFTPAQTQIFHELHRQIQEREQGRIFTAKNREGCDTAALYLIWDRESAYYWLPCMDEELGRDGAAQLLCRHAIQFSMDMEKNFNFEGSMLPHIEPVFRAFGGRRHSVYQLRKFQNRFFEMAWVLLSRRS